MQDMDQLKTCEVGSMGFTERSIFQNDLASDADKYCHRSTSPHCEKQNTTNNNTTKAEREDMILLQMHSRIF